MPAPATSSRHLYTGHRQGNTQAAPWLRARQRRAFVPGTLRFPGFDAIVRSVDASAVVHTRSTSRRTPDPLTAGLLPQRSPPRLLTDAACGGLGSPPARRTRRANPHHWHSTVRAGDLLHRHHSPFRTHHRWIVVAGEASRFYLTLWLTVALGSRALSTFDACQGLVLYSRSRPVYAQHEHRD